MNQKTEQAYKLLQICSNDVSVFDSDLRVHLVFNRLHIVG